MTSHLTIFGTPELRDSSGRAVAFRTRKHLALLVYLVLEARQRAAPRDLLIEFLWPSVPLGQGRHSLSQALTAIRAGLGNDAVTRGGTGVRFLGQVTTDIDLVATDQDLPHGFAEPLRGLDQVGSTAFSHWVDAAREQCRQGVRQVLMEQLDAARAHGDHRRVHERAERLYRVDPLSEHALQALAEQLLHQGDSSAAVRLVRSHVERIENDLRCRPSAHLERLLDRVERGLVPTAQAVRGVPVAPPRYRPQIFVGREPELARLEASWAEALGGSLRRCLVIGPAGIGKSSLLRRFATSVAVRDAAVWEVTCQEIGRNIPFAAVSELIHALSRDPGLSGTDARWLAEASRVAPGLRSLYPGVPEPPPVPPESVRLRIAEALARMLEVVTDGRPSLVVLDDIGFLDPASRDVLHVLLRRLAGRPFLLLASSRIAESQTLAGFDEGGSQDLGWDDEVVLPSLPEDTVLVLIEALCRATGEPPLVVRDTLAHLAGGNPYLIEMLVSDWQRSPDDSLVVAHAHGDGTAARWRPPETMRRAFERQYRGLAANAERMVNLLAVAGRKLAAGELGALLGLSAGDADMATLELLDRGIVRLEEGGVAFKNEMHRSFVYFAMAEETRRFLHAKVAQALEDECVSLDFQHAMEAAHHFMRAALNRPALRALMQGAGAALSRGAPREAEQALSQALPLSEQAERPLLTLLSGEAKLARGQHEHALQLFRTIDTKDLSRYEAARVLVAQAEALQRGQLADRAAIDTAVGAALQTALQVQDESLAARALQATAEAAYDTLDAKSIEQVRAAAQELAQRSGSQDVKCAAAATQAYCHMVTGTSEEAATLFTDAARGFRAMARDWDLRRSLTGLGICLSSMGDWQAANPCFLEAVTLADQIGDRHALCVLWDNLAVLYEDVGWYEEAVAARQRAFGFAQQSSPPRREAELCANAASLALTLGNLEEARDFLDRAVAVARTVQLPVLLTTTLIGRADLHIALEDYESAWAFVEEALSTARTLPDGGTSIGDFDRARSHFLWATRGYDSLGQLRSQRRRTWHSVRLSQELELRALLEWIERAEGKTNQERSAVLEMQSRQLYGAIAHLAVLHILPQGGPERLPGESSAQLVTRVFLQSRQTSVPRSVAAIPPADGSRCYA